MLSVYVRTDPRDPANTATPPGWLVELRNGLREVSRTVEEADARGQRLALRDLRERVERELVALRPAERGRGLAWFVTADGALDQRFTLQLPPHGTLVRWDDYPFVSPLADVADQGRPTALCWPRRRLSACCTGGTPGLPSQHGRCMRSRVANGVTMTPTWDIPAGRPAGMHVAEFDQRLDEWRRRFLRSTAEAVARQLTGLGWDRIVLAGERRVTDAFLEQLPEPVPGRVIAAVEANLIWEGTHRGRRPPGGNPGPGQVRGGARAGGEGTRGRFGWWRRRDRLAGSDR